MFKATFVLNFCLVHGLTIKHEFWAIILKKKIKLQYKKLKDKEKLAQDELLKLK